MRWKYYKRCQWSMLQFHSKRICINFCVKDRWTFSSTYFLWEIRFQRPFWIESDLSQRFKTKLSKSIFKLTAPAIRFITILQAFFRSFQVLLVKGEGVLFKKDLDFHPNSLTRHRKDTSFKQTLSLCKKYSHFQTWR